MINDIQNLKKIGDILNSEGPLLGLHQHKDKLYLSSYFNDGSGSVYYSVDVQTLTRYFNNEVRLREIYLSSENAVVLRSSRMETAYFIKEELTELISCGESLYSENSEGLRNDNLVIYL